MPRIRITSPGWTNFNGYFGVIEFKDSVSVEAVGRIETERLAALIQFETVPDDENDAARDPSAAQRIVETYADNLGHATLLTQAELPKPPEPEKPTYTPEQLADLADAGGIAAVRKAAEPLGVTGASISELIGKILAVAGPKAPIDPAVQADATESVELTDSAEVEALAAAEVRARAEAEAAALAEAEAAAAAEIAAQAKADAKAARAAKKAAKAAAAAQDAASTEAAESTISE